MYTPRDSPAYGPVLEYLDGDDNVKTMDINRLEAMIETGMDSCFEKVRFRDRELHNAYFKIEGNVIQFLYRRLEGIAVRVDNKIKALSTLQLMFEAVKARWKRESFALLNRFATCIPVELQRLIGEYMAPEEPPMYIAWFGPLEKDSAPFSMLGRNFRRFRFAGPTPGLHLEPGMIRGTNEIVPPHMWKKDHPNIYFHPGTSYAMAKRIFDIYNDAS